MVSKIDAVIEAFVYIYYQNHVNQGTNEKFFIGSWVHSSITDCAAAKID